MAIDPNAFKITPGEMTPEQLEAAAELLAKKMYTDARVEAGEIKGSYTKPWSELSEEEKAKRMQYSKRRNAKISVILRKAAEAGIGASEAEIDAELASKEMQE